MEKEDYDIENIIKTIKDRGLTAYELSKKLPISEVGINKILNGTSQNPRKTTLQVLHNYLFKNQDVSEISVLEPHEHYVVENKNSNQFVHLENGQYLMIVPLAEYNIQAGFLDHYQDIEYLNGLGKHSIIVDKPVQGRYIAFRVEGHSMDSGRSDQSILKDSIVTTRELQRQHWTSRIRFNDFPYWVIYTSQSRYPLLKEIIAHDVEKGVITCHSLNEAPEFTDFDLSLNDVNALFYVVDVHRSLSRKITY